MTQLQQPSSNRTKIHGGNGGSEFHTFSNLKIRGISLFSSFDGLSLQILYDDGTLQKVGDRDTTYNGTLDLTDDFINYIEIHHAVYVSKIVIKTGNGQLVEASTAHKGELCKSKYQVDNDQCISGFYGRAGAWLDSIGLIIEKKPLQQQQQQQLKQQISNTKKKQFESATTTTTTTASAITYYPAAKPLVITSGKGGGVFQTFYGSPITHLTIFYSNYVNGISLDFKNKQRQDIATCHGLSVTFGIAEDDQIAEVGFIADSYVESMSVRTTKGVFRATNAQGVEQNLYKTFACNAGEQIVGFCGRCGGWMDAIGVLVLDTKRPLYKTSIMGSVRYPGQTFQTLHKSIKEVTFHGTQDECFQGVTVHYDDGSQQQYLGGQTGNTVQSIKLEDILSFSTSISRSTDLITQVTIITRDLKLFRIGMQDPKLDDTKYRTDTVIMRRGMVVQGIHGLYDAKTITALGLTFEEAETMFLWQNSQLLDATTLLPSLSDITIQTRAIATMTTANR